jgi:Flp pilus assembly protein TadD
MGIPGGDKHEGIRQLENAMEHGQLTAVEARFYLARNLRTYDHEYEHAVEVLAPLTQQFPQNPLFALMLGNMYSLLGRKQEAESNYHAAAAMAVKDPDCAARIQEIAKQALAAFDASNPQN